LNIIDFFSDVEHFFPGIAPLVSILLFPKNIDDFSLLIQKKNLQQIQGSSRSTTERAIYGKQRICFSNSGSAHFHVSWLSDFIFYHKPYINRFTNHFSTRSVVERLQATLSMPLNDRGISD
jgi:hypothetical protein